MNRLAAALIAAFRGRQGPRPPRVVSIDDLLHDRDSHDLDDHFTDARAVVEAGRVPAARTAVDDTNVLDVVPAPIAPAPPPALALHGVNAQLLRHVLDHITTHPGVWDQTHWWVHAEGCGTTGCVAGWAVYFGRPDVRVDETNTNADVRLLDGTRIGTVPHVAGDVLGLSPAQRLMLFDPANTLRDLWTLAARYTAGEITMPDQLPDGS